MKFIKIICTLMLWSIALIGFSQDLVITKTKQRIECNILREDSLLIHISINRLGYNKITTVKKVDIDTIIYNMSKPIISDKKLKTQDLIIKKNKEIIYCTILEEDSLLIRYSIKYLGDDKETFTYKKEIDSVAYNIIPYNGYYHKDKILVGIGLGQEYGGMGFNLLVYLQRNIGIFGGVGYPLAGLGYNFGTKIRFLRKIHDSGSSPYLIGMYGYNTAVRVTNMQKLNKLFYGATVGFGLDYKSRPQNIGYISFSLLYPIRTNAPNDYMKMLETNHKVVFKNKLLPITFGIGIHFIL